MVLLGITLVPLAEYLRQADPTLVYLLYAKKLVFNGLARRSAAQLKLIMARGTDWGYFPEPAKSLFIADNSEGKDVGRREFERAGLNLNYTCGSR